MSHKNYNNLSSEFKHAVSDAINRGNFKKLNHLVTDTVTDVIADAATQFKSTADTSRPFVFRKQLPISKTKNVGHVSSILYMVLGGIGTIAMAFLLFFLLLAMSISGLWESIPIAIFSLLGTTFGGVFAKGISQRKRLDRMKRYISLCDDNMYVNISTLAEHTHKKTSYVLKDIKKMLHLGFFPEGHLDKNGTCLMLDDNTYQEYLRVEKERQILAEKEAEKKVQKADAQPTDTQNAELLAIMNEGQDYIQKLHHLNDLIEDELVSSKLYRMERLLKEIFDRLQDDPSQMPKMRKLMNYYLPTTIKLLQAYSEFDDVSAPGQDIMSAKTEIEKTIDIINEAFEELLNKLFQTSAFDAATDAQVLQTMLAKEGLTKSKLTEGEYE